ncbi:chromosome partitioning protein ParB [Rhizobium rhizoryzae]|uniref:Chromosome partitioning protein ParB n=1 Tax=Rhizobium rhizoryzae TaxID=451876 RepID=A0A7W6PUM0_9HYPH|nr:chromosome partitioning protein ParB [Rhizobium rhizoryzae]MBB4146010.1 hypothetical protein [Rhizobium rhizoryzae]
MTDFKVNFGDLRKKDKAATPTEIAKVDAAGETHGFVDRSPRGRPGRKKSERTGQVHAKVLPHVSEEIANEAIRRGVVQGVIIEEAWALYKTQKF